MPKKPDFEQIALLAVRYLPVEEAVAAVKEQLRQVWNARGAADIETLEAEWREGLDLAPAVRALRSVDR